MDMDHEIMGFELNECFDYIFHSSRSIEVARDPVLGYRS